MPSHIRRPKIVFLEKIGNALDRMSELAVLAQDETKTDSDRSLYDKEFKNWTILLLQLRGKISMG